MAVWMVGDVVKQDESGEVWMVSKVSSALHMVETMDVYGDTHSHFTDQAARRLRLVELGSIETACPKVWRDTADSAGHGNVLALHFPRQ